MKSRIRGHIQRNSHAGGILQLLRPQHVSCDSAWQFTSIHSTAWRHQSLSSSTPSPAKATGNSGSGLTKSHHDANASPSSALNPPASTRPPPLDLPVRGDPANTSLFKHLFRLGKAYVTFYKNGVKAIVTNYRLVRELDQQQQQAQAGPSNPDAQQPTRASRLLRERTRHDLSRLPLFGLMFLICGEFTPLAVLVFPRITPLTCRIPRQIDKLRRKAAERREAARRGLGYALQGRGAGLGRGSPASETETQQGGTDRKGYSDGAVARTLGLGVRVWDKAGLDPPFARRRADAALRRIWEDDVLILRGGGVGRLEDEEVVLACEERAVEVRGVEVGVLKECLERWVRTTAWGGEGKGKVRGEKEGLEAVRRMVCVGLEEGSKEGDGGKR